MLFYFENVQSHARQYSLVSTPKIKSIKVLRNVFKATL